MTQEANSSRTAWPVDERAPDVDALGAIDALSEINRVAPDVTRERRLVELRHAAVAQLDRPGRATATPRFVADPFPGALLPELDARDLSADAVRGGVVHHGAVLARGLVDPPGVATLVDCIDRALDGAGKRRAGMQRGLLPPHSDPWFSPFGRVPFALGMGTEWIRMVDSPRTMFEFTERLQPLGGLLSDYFGERPVMNSNKWTLRRITPECGGGWHQDGRVIADGSGALNVWIALTRCGGTTGASGLEVVARPLELLPTGTGGADFDWSIDHTLLERAADGTISDPVYEPGDALIFDERTAHRTGHRPGLTGPRHAIEAWFFAPSRHTSPDRAFIF